MAGLGDRAQLFSRFLLSFSSLAAPPREREERNARKGEDERARCLPRLPSSDAVVMTESTVNECVRGTPSRIVMIGGAEGKLAPPGARFPLLPAPLIWSGVTCGDAKGVLAPLPGAVDGRAASPPEDAGRPLEDVGREVMPEIGDVKISLVGRLLRPRFSSLAALRSSLLAPCPCPPKPNQEDRDGVGARGTTAGSEAEWCRWLDVDDGGVVLPWSSRDCDEVEALLSVRARALASLVRWMAPRMSWSA